MTFSLDAILSRSMIHLFKSHPWNWNFYSLHVMVCTLALRSTQILNLRVSNAMLVFFFCHTSEIYRGYLSFQGLYMHYGILLFFFLFEYE